MVLTIHQVALAATSLTDAQRAWLSPEEAARAARLHSAALAERWRVAHVALRAVLSGAVGVPPGAVRFTADARGRPALDHPSAPQFSLSHAGDHAVIAVGGTAPLGVDLEPVRTIAEMDGVARTHFAPEEREALAAAPAAERALCFLRIWTRKEAFLKATGVGVGPGLSRFAVSAGATDARLLRDDDAPDAIGQWCLADLGLALPYVGALAVRTPGVRWTLQPWPG